MKENDEVYLNHIVDAIERIEEYCQGVSRQKFLKNKMVAAAAVRELEIIGEAARNVSREFRKMNPELPWEQMTGTRNRLIHEYFGVDLEIVWQTIIQDLPNLKNSVKHLLE